MKPETLATQIKTEMMMTVSGGITTGSTLGNEFTDTDVSFTRSLTDEAWDFEDETWDFEDKAFEP